MFRAREKKEKEKKLCEVVLVLTNLIVVITYNIYVHQIMELQTLNM